MRPQAELGAAGQTIPFKLAIIIPTLNGAERVRRLCAELKNTLTAYISFTLLVVDDGSTPEQAQLLRQLAATQPYLRLVRLDGNYGQRIATIAGTALTCGELILTMDDDGSHPPAAILPALACLQAQPDIDLLYLAPSRMPGGRTFGFGQPALWRQIGTLANNFLFHTCLGLPWQVPVGSFRLFRAELARAALQRPVCWPYLSAMLLSCRPSVAVQFYSLPVATETPGSRRKKKAASSYSLRKLAGLYLRLVWYWGPFRILAGWFCRARLFNPADYGVKA